MPTRQGPIRCDPGAGPPPRLRVRGRSGRRLTVHAALTERAEDRHSELVVIIEPVRAEDQ